MEKKLKGSQHYYGYCVKCGSKIICDTNLFDYEDKYETDKDCICFCSNEECKNHKPECYYDDETPEYYVSKEKNKLTKIQICVSAKTEEETKIAVCKIKKLKNKLDVLYSGNYTLHSCLLPKHILTEKGFNSTLVDTLIETFGDRYSSELDGEKDFDSAISKLDDYRKGLSKKVDNLFIISTTPVSKVALELQLFTENKVRVF